MTSLDLHSLLHRVKRRLYQSPALRRAIRRYPLAAYQRLQLSKIARCSARAPRGSGDLTVHVLAFRPWPIHRAWESVLTGILRSEGCRVVWVACDGVMQRCDAMQGPLPEPNLCRLCQRETEFAAKANGVELLQLSKFRRHDNQSPLSNADIDSLVSVSTRRTLGTAAGTLSQLKTAQERKIYQQLATSAQQVCQSAQQLLESHVPDLVVALNGKFFSEKAYLQAAKHCGAEVWTYERGNRKNTIVLSNREAAIPFDSRGIVEALQTDPLTAEQDATIRSYLEGRLRSGNGQVQFLAEHSEPLQLPTAKDTSIVGLFTNLVWDSSVADEDTIFDDMFDWLRTTIHLASQKPHLHLAIRVHPAETKVYWHPTKDTVQAFLAEQFPQGLPSNVSVLSADSAVDSYELVERCDTVIAYTSTIGMEAAIRGKAVVVAANAHYRGAPFVHSPQSVESYLALLSERTLAPPVSNASDLALRYAYRLYFESMFPVGGVEENPTGFRAAPSTVPRSEQLAQHVRQLLASLRARRNA